MQKNTTFERRRQNLQVFNNILCSVVFLAASAEVCLFAARFPSLHHTLCVARKSCGTPWNWTLQWCTSYQGAQHAWTLQWCSAYQRAQHMVELRDYQVSYFFWMHNYTIWSNMKPSRFLKLSLKKLDGIGTLDNRPSYESLHHFFQFVLWFIKCK